MSEAIRLLDSTGTKVLDSVSTEYEDSFCLESFGDLVSYHAESEPKGSKAFIIARVQTWDPKQPEKAFYSYYNAWHLNKILFQTQVYLGKKLIHRLHVLNPLTNTDIIGNVQYFMVRPDSIVENVRSKAELQRTVVVESPKRKASFMPHRGSNAVPPPIITLKKASVDAEMFLVASPTVKQVENGETATWTLACPVVADISDNEPGADARKGSIAHLLRRVSNVLSPKASSPMSEIPEVPPPEKSFSPTGASPRRPTITPLDINALSKAATSPIRLTSHGVSPQSTTSIPAGKVTRFCVPVPQSELSVITPKTAKSRRRSLSYANAVNASGNQASHEEWLAMVQSERSPDRDVTEDDYDVVKPFGGDVFSPKREAILEEDEEGEGKEAPPTSPTKEFKMFDAVLFATDNDFLESAKIRSIFKLNSIQTEDAVLFEMKPFTGEEPESPLVVVIEDNPACEICYPSPATLSRASPCMQTFHRVKCYVAALILMMAMFFFIFFTLRDNSNRSGGGSPPTPSIKS
ncbi:hypothetical protein HDU97_004600 [Phlyctochytrium planicorne]|nr:hypothetical protein HDU97_004600 [Phlyctochytrium planicorne]